MKENSDGTWMQMDRSWRGSLAEKANAIRLKSDLEQQGLGTVQVNQEQ